MGIMVSVLGGNWFRVECSHYEGMRGDAHPSLKGSVVLTIATDNGEVTLHLDPSRAVALETAIGQCLRDRAAVLSMTADSDEDVEIADTSDIDKSIADGITEDDRKAVYKLGGSIGY